MKEIYFDMDGTLVDFYNEKRWLEDIKTEKIDPYINAKSLVDISSLIKELKVLKRENYKIGIISWTAKNSRREFHERVIDAKKEWLRRNFKDFNFDEIIIIEYGKSKWEQVKEKNSILFDDCSSVREDWKGISFTEKEIFKVLKELSKFA